MDSQTKRTLLAAVLMVAIILGWFRFQAWMYPPQPYTPPASQPVAQTTQPGGSVVSATTAPTSPSASPTGDGLFAAAATPVPPITIGDDRQNKPNDSFTNPYEFAATINPRGASVERLNLSRHRNHVAKKPKDPDHDPYKLLAPLHDKAKSTDRLSFATRSIKIDNESLSLEDLIWSARPVKSGGADAVELETTISRGGAKLMRLVKSFRVTEGDPQLALTISIENLSGQPHQVILTESGPCGITRDDPRMPYGHVVAALIDEAKQITMGDHPLRKAVFDAPQREMVLREAEGRHTLWAALSNKYFTSVVAPKLDAAEWYPTELAQVAAEAPFPEADADDLTFRYVLTPGKVEANATSVFNIDVYCGPKSKPTLSKIPVAEQRDYYAILSRPDVSYCTFDMLGRAMHWLVTKIYSVVGNYGLAIICLVIVVKLILHPLSKRGQLVMTRTQRGMARLKPKLDALNEQYKGDKQKLSAETFKLYREENVSPTGPLMGCLPMFIQIPIWGALWSMLNTNVDIRHKPFMGWMHDLTSPDALITLPESMHFTIPLIGHSMMGGPITAFNILPIVMVITMYTQQKIMQKLTQPENKPAPKLDAQGRPIPDPMEQQQKMMPYMMGFMGLLFYNSPSGLNLYIWVNSLLGVVEQFQIRRVIKRMEAAGQLVDKKPPPDNGPGNRVLSTDGGPPKSGWLANLQKKMEAMQQAQSQRDRTEPGRGKKKSRF